MAGMADRMFMTVGVLTISDRCSSGVVRDGSGPLLVKMVRDGVVGAATIVEQAVVPDEQGPIQQVLKTWTDDGKINVILTTGGTGLGSRDVTPEATAAILDRLIPGISTLLLSKCLAVTPLAALSRGVAGVRGKSLIVNLPGSSKACRECLEAVAPVISHAVDLILGKERCVASSHAQLQGEQVKLSKVKGLSVAHRERRSKYPLVSVEDAQNLVMEHTWQGPCEVASLASALGRVLAVDVVAADPLPPFPASIKDGYAIVHDDGCLERLVVGTSSAGDAGFGFQVLPGTCVRINTGACLPQGCDAVVQVEDTEVLETAEDGEEEVKIRFETVATAGQDVRQIGSDIEPGGVVLKRGCSLGPCELGVLAAVGVTHVSVIAQPRIGVLSTGNELQEPEEPLRSGMIRDSNRTTLMSLLRQEGFSPVDLGIVPDDPDHQFSRMSCGFRQVDVLITTGSVSMGDRDFLKQVLEMDFDATIHFGRVHMKPGKPTSFATADRGGRKLWFGLPGNPVSAAVTCHLFVLPALRKLAGSDSPLPTVVKVVLAEETLLDPRPEFRRAVLSWQDRDVPWASTTGNQISSRLLSCVGAHVLLRLPAASSAVGTLHRGAVVDALLLRRLN